MTHVTARSMIGTAAAIVLAGITTTACSSAPKPAASSAPTAPAAPAASTSPGAPAATTSPSAPASPPAGMPTLGQAAGVFAHGRGFGRVRPPEIFNGGDPTGLVTHVIWATWGGPRAVGTGISDYVGPGQTVAGGKQELATIVAFNLGTCHGKRMYQAVEWYFTQQHQAFNPGRYENICTGTYVPAG